MSAKQVKFCCAAFSTSIPSISTYKTVGELPYRIFMLGLSLLASIADLDKYFGFLDNRYQLAARI